jgi:hypothetical protein
MEVSWPGYLGAKEVGPGREVVGVLGVGGLAASFGCLADMAEGQCAAGNKG